MDTILVAVDFSNVTDDVCHTAERLALRLACQVIVVHVAEPRPVFVDYGVGPQPVRNSVASDLTVKRRAAQRIAADLRSRGVDAMALLVQGPTVETLLGEVDRRRAQLIVLGSHGHGPLRMALTGSVAAGVLKHAICPVLIVPVRAHAIVAAM